MIFSLSYLFVYRNSPKFLLWNFGAHFFPSTNVWSNRRWMFSFMFFLLNWLQSNSSVIGSPNINLTTYGNPLFCSFGLEKKCGRSMNMSIEWNGCIMIIFPKNGEEWMSSPSVCGLRDPSGSRRWKENFFPANRQTSVSNSSSLGSWQWPQFIVWKRANDSFLSLLHHIFLTCKFPKNWKEFVNGWNDRLAMMESL